MSAAPDDFSPEPINPREKPMGFFEHLEDLRWTLVKSAIAFAIFAGFIGFYLKEFNNVVLWPLHHVQAQKPTLNVDLGTTSIMEGFTVVVEVCCVGGIFMAAPFILFFLGQFVAPALTQKEMRMVLPGCLVAFLLFLTGGTFSFFLLVPTTLKVSLELNELFGFATRWTPDSYYSLLMWLVLGVGASFEFPLLIILLVHIGLLQVATLRKYRRHAIIVILIISAVVTPTPDPFTQLMFATPLYILYEIAIIASARVERRRALERA
ncbi:MAG TPA: twin-arginine translocase subunit TatC [Opitutaceae bacterium]|nr:twin-arginine translocase subunit TatC [Opitutaceae bacterium]